MRAFFGLHLGREWRLFDLVRAPSEHRLPAVLTRGEVARLFAVVREPRFRTLLRLIYACGLRLGEALTRYPLTAGSGRKHKTHRE